MTTQSANLNSSGQAFSLARFIPFIGWMREYDRQQLTGDIIAGIIVAVMLVPQSMAYALLAGLPPQVGLYASIAPLIIYGFMGSSRVLAVGPVAMVSLLVATTVSQFADPGSADYITIVLTLTLLTAAIQAAMGFARIGFLVNFLSHPVLSGFTSAAALIIGISQLKDVLGITIPRFEHPHETLLFVGEHIAQTNGVTLGIAAVSIGILLYFKFFLGKQLRSANVSESIVVPATKLGPLVIVALGAVAIWLLGWNDAYAVKIVGDVPAGLPPIVMPSFDLNLIVMLLPSALTISLVGYMESISIAKSLASKRRQKVDANQELIALGMANLGSAFTGGYPVTGGLSRSVVNFAAGANTGLASIITAVLIALTVVFLTPLFYFLPKAVLASIIIVAVATLFDFQTFKHTWHASKPDAVALLLTFFAVLSIGVESGIIVGAAAAIILHLWQTSHPQITRLGRMLGTEQYLDVEQYPEVETQPDVLMIRVDESLYFPNAHHIEEYILNVVANEPEIKAVVLVFSAINTIDASAMHVMEGLVNDLRASDIDFYLSEVKPPVMHRLENAGCVHRIGKDHIFTSTFEAYLNAKVPQKAKNNPAVATS